MNWMKLLPIYFLISAVVILPGVYSLVRYGLRLSIEFTGGTNLTLSSVQQDSSKVLETFSLYAPSLVSQDKNLLTLRMKEASQAAVVDLLSTLQSSNPQIKLESFETVGPALGSETIKKTIYALLLSTTLLLGYITLAFKQIKYGLCAIIAMLHDTLVLMGSFSIFGFLFHTEIDLLFVTAVLTILSFSVHDTIVVYDRIRELSHKEKGIDFVSLVNQAVTETMARSLNNSLTIIFMLLAMVLIGGETIRNFSLALLIGTITGTYSSTFTAAPLLVAWDKFFKTKK